MTATPAPTATPIYYVELETPAGEGARVDRIVNMGDLAVLMLLIGVLVSIWAMRVASLRERMKGQEK